MPTGDETAGGLCFLSIQQKALHERSWKCGYRFQCLLLEIDFCYEVIHGNSCDVKSPEMTNFPVFLRISTAEVQALRSRAEKYLAKLN